MNKRKLATTWYVRANKDDHDFPTRNLDWVVIPGSNENWKLRLDYPLDHEFDFSFDAKSDMTKEDLLRAICQVYRSIYKSPKKYGIWGHGIGDLVIEGITINSDKHLVTVSVGS